jgi:hypothetical protein
MTHLELIEILKDAGITDGFCLHGLEIVIWEHDEEPPAPLVRPQEATDEALDANADIGTSPD